MCKRYSVKILVFALVALQTACQSVAGTSTSPASAEEEIRRLSQAVAAAEARKDFDTAVLYFSDDAVVHAEAMAPIRGRAAIRKSYPEFFKPILNFRGELEDVVVSRGGYMAYETGINHMTVSTPTGAVDTLGKYLAVWRREADSEWRIVAVAITANPAK